MRGLVIGKFMPIHLGHVALINFAAQQCHELIVSMSYTDADPIHHNLRFQWICEIFQHDKRIKPALVKDDFDDETLPWNERTKIWADFIRKTYPAIDVLFTSEKYGEPFGRHLGVKHISFDPFRLQIPVSATRIRENPFHYWSFIPPVVRPYFIKRICFYGAESTGKSFMAKRMADIFQTEFVPEVAREMISSNDFTIVDCIRIGYAQTERVMEKTNIANKFLFCDTDLITTQIYSNYYLHEVPAVLYELEKMIHYDRYYLFDIDVPWVADHLRDLGEKRSEMNEIFKRELEKRKIPYTIVQGTYQEREIFVEQEMNKLLP
jgi:HTH-type transcriptional repressor of NAD biosynthesis genes